MLDRWHRKKRLAPSLQIDRVDPIRQRPLCRSRTSSRLARRTQQFGPAFLYKPADHRVRERMTQRLRGWKGMNYISHRTETYDQHAFDSFLIGSAQDFLGKRRARRISLVE
jgi:hypothetical protein